MFSLLGQFFFFTRVVPSKFLKIWSKNHQSVVVLKIKLFIFTGTFLVNFHDLFLYHGFFCCEMLF